MEEEIEIDVVEVDEDPDSDIDIEGEDEVDGQTHIPAAAAGWGEDEVDGQTPTPAAAADWERGKADGVLNRQEEVTWMARHKTTGGTSYGQEKKIDVKGEGDEMETTDGKSDVAVESERKEERSPGTNRASAKSLSPDVIMADVTEADPRRRERSGLVESSRAEHVRSAEVTSEVSRGVGMAPRVAETTGSTARDKRRKSDTIWSPWK